MSETDRELLELAAKAAGYSGTLIRDGLYNRVTMFGCIERWNPLIDDHDAIRLSRMLRININYDPRNVPRREIVIAAAEIGKAMNGEYQAKVK